MYVLNCSEKQNKNTFAYFFLDSAMTPVVESFRHSRQGPSYPTESTPWLLMPWWPMKLTYHQALYWHRCPRIFSIKSSRITSYCNSIWCNNLALDHCAWHNLCYEHCPIWINQVIFLFGMIWHLHKNGIFSQFELAKTSCSEMAPGTISLLLLIEWPC